MLQPSPTPWERGHENLHERVTTIITPLSRLRERGGGEGIGIAAILSSTFSRSHEKGGALIFLQQHIKTVEKISQGIFPCIHHICHSGWRLFICQK